MAEMAAKQTFRLKIGIWSGEWFWQDTVQVAVLEQKEVVVVLGVPRQRWVQGVGVATNIVDGAATPKMW